MTSELENKVKTYLEYCRTYQVSEERFKTKLSQINELA